MKTILHHLRKLLLATSALHHESKGENLSVSNWPKQNLLSNKKSLLHTWKITDDEDDSPFFEKLKPEPLHNRRSMVVTGIQDLLSNADNKAFESLWVAASLLSKVAKYSLYCTRTDIDWRRRSLRSALDILGSLKWVTTKVT